ncbi:MAG TPA: hypothetical protein VIM11_09020 [Tepidisphaeraceae bacterium]|jgi:hypothetical protein
MNKETELTGRRLDAMTPVQKQKIVDDIDRSTPARRRAQSTAPTPAQRARLDRAAKKMGRPRLGKGTRVVSVTVEVDLLKRADAFATAQGLKRSELFTRGLKSVLPANA